MNQEQLQHLDDIRRRRSDLVYEIDAMRSHAELVKEDGKFTARIFDGRDQLVFMSRVPYQYVTRVFKNRWNKLHEELAKIDKEIEEL